jgi:two-component system NtrC family sensor kinase
VSEAKKMDTDPVIRIPPSGKDSHIDPDQILASRQRKRPTWRLHFELGPDSTAAFDVDLTDEICLGAVAAPDTFDLSPYHGREHGVSRRHAMLRATDDAIGVLDLGSTNGTHLNGHRLRAQTLYTIAEGDTLTLGKLSMTMQTATPPQGARQRQAVHPPAASPKVKLADALKQMAKAITSQLDLEEVLNQALEMTISLTAAHEAAIWLVDERSDELFLEAEFGIEETAIRHMRLPVVDSKAGEVIRTGKSLWDNRGTEEDPVKVKTGYLVEAVLYMPLSHGGTTFGVLSAVHREMGREFSDQDDQLLEAIADFAAIAIHNARMYQQIQQNDQVKTEMIQNISHEIRTPLQIMLGYVDLILEGQDPLTDAQRQYLQIMSQQADRLTWLMDNIVTLQSTYDKRLPSVQRVELAPLLAGSLEQYRPRAKEHGIQLFLTVEQRLPAVWTNPLAVFRVMDNLLSNALKFTPEEGQVTISAGLAEPGKAVHVSITDTGIGIPPEAHERIFERFFQYDGGMARHFGGIGLGLAVCKELLGQYGSRIWVDSTVGEGSTFTFTLPVAPSTSGADG